MRRGGVGIEERRKGKGMRTARGRVGFGGEGRGGEGRGGERRERRGVGEERRERREEWR